MTTQNTNPNQQNNFFELNNIPSCIKHTLAESIREWDASSTPPATAHPNTSIHIANVFAQFLYDIKFTKFDREVIIKLMHSMGPDWAALTLHLLQRTLNTHILNTISTASYNHSTTTPNTILPSATELALSLMYKFTDTQNIAMSIAYTRYHCFLNNRTTLINKIYNNNIMRPIEASVDLLLSELLKHNPRHPINPTNQQLREKLRSLNPDNSALVDMSIQRVAVFAIEALNIGFSKFNRTHHASSLTLMTRSNIETMPFSEQLKKMGITHGDEWLHFIRDHALIDLCLRECTAVFKRRNDNNPSEQLENLLHATLSANTAEHKRQNLTQLATMTFPIPGATSLPPSMTSLQVPFHFINFQEAPVGTQDNPKPTFTNFNKHNPIFCNGLTGTLNQNIRDLIPLQKFSPHPVPNMRKKQRILSK